MPELPEVETVARQLRPELKNKVIKSVEVFDKKLSSKKFSKVLGAKILDVFREGKQVVFKLSNGLFIVVHLRMTGRLILGSKKLSKFYYNPDNNIKHTRFKLVYNKGEMDFVDTRRFGTVDILDSLEPIGIDPVSTKFTEKSLQEMLHNNSQTLKNFLMRQDKIVGIGNIYASEILFDAKLKPTRKTSSLKAIQIKKLFNSIKKILNKAIKNCGTTFSDFQTTTGEVGSFQKFLKVYSRNGEKCYVCKEEIKKITQQQRSTFYCSKCQK